jgi:hypothetical protein
VEPLILLRGVREVAALANPEEPARAPRSAFDAERERSPEHADLPAARRITEQLKMPWREVLAVAHAPEAAQNKLLGVKARSAPVNWLTRDGVRSALRVAALRRGVDSLTLAEYRAERNAMLAADRARWLHGGALRLPTDEQVIAVADSWEAALRLAGLAPGSPRPRTVQQVALTRVAVIERFHEHYGKRPSRPELEAFARGNGLPMKAERNRKWSEIVAEWERQRRDRGLPPARVAARPPGRPSPKRPRTRTSHYGRNVGAARAGEHRVMGKWTHGKCAAAVARYLAQLPVGARSTERGYTDWAATQPRGTVPTMSTIQEHGGWEAVRREANEQCSASKGLRSDSTN